MWSRAHPDIYSSYNCDPVEVRLLKKQLANLSCKHDFKKYPTLYEIKPDSYEREVQVRCEKDDEATQTPCNLTSGNIFNPFNNVSICPTCLITFSLLNGGVTKVMKDEELVTEFKVINSDKSADNVLDFVSRTTSFTSPPYSDCGFHDYSSECVYDNMYKHHSPRRSNHEVSFLDAYFGHSLPENGMTRESPHNVCMDSFMNSIRPPL